MKPVNLASAHAIRTRLRSLSGEAKEANLRLVTHLIEVAIEDLNDVLRHHIHLDATVKEHIDVNISESTTRH